MPLESRPILWGGPGPAQDGILVPAHPNAAPARPPTTTQGAPRFEDAVGEPVRGPSFALAISHCDWLADRVACMAECRPTLLSAWSGPYKELTLRAPNHGWSRVMWGWGVAQNASHGVYLQDDLHVHPQFWPIVRAIVAVHPTRVIALLSNHPLAPRAAKAGHRFLRCGEVLGSAYIVPTMLMACFLEARERWPYALQVETEDFQLTRWLAETGRRAWHVIPGLVQTRPEIPTTEPRWTYPYRTSTVPWTHPHFAGLDLTDPGVWRADTAPPDYGATCANDTRLPRGPFTDEEIKRGENL